MPNLRLLFVFIWGVLAAWNANAALVTNPDGQTVYDTDLNITWVSNANLAASNTFGLAKNTYLSIDGYGGSVILTNGSMTWGGAQTWIAAMNSSNYLGYSDWRLPSTTDMGTPGCNYSTNSTDCGYNSTGSEMSHLYYSELANKGFYDNAGSPQPGYGLANKGPFTNFEAAYYWSGQDESTPGNAWAFMFGYGGQQPQYKSYYLYALAVRDGQVASIPIPASILLLFPGFFTLIGIARLKKLR